MNLPYIIAVDDDPQVLSAIRRDLRKHYRKHYRILTTDSAQEALDTLPELRKRGEEVALFLSDQRMPQIDGVSFLEKAKTSFPLAKRVLLTAYSDTQAAIKAINDVQLDFYLMKPWDPPEEKLYPTLDDLLDQWQVEVKPNSTALRLVGFGFTPRSHQLKDFLAGNLVPYRWLDALSPEGQEFLQLHGLSEDHLPAVALEDGQVMTTPKLPDLADKLGVSQGQASGVYDVAIIGAGPAGMAAAVYGGSEGLRTVLIEKRAPGGQAGTSSRIENYLGFPKGLSGAELTHRAITQATRFGIQFLVPRAVARLELKDSYKILHLDDGTTVSAKTVVLTAGMDYRRLPAQGLDNLTGAGVYYGAANTEAHACRGQEVFIVGGGNSAGQAAMFLSNYAKKVHVVIRKPDLTSSMSHYLIRQLEATENIDLMPRSQVVSGTGTDRLESVHIENLDTGQVQAYPTNVLLIFIGTRPNTDWLPKDLLRNDRGFVLTGNELMAHPHAPSTWPLRRDAFLLESSIPGLFAAGDIRSGAMNRVASAVGEGAMSVKYVHEYLAEN